MNSHAGSWGKFKRPKTRRPTIFMVTSDFINFELKFKFPDNENVKIIINNKKYVLSMVMTYLIFYNDNIIFNNETINIFVQ